MKTLEDTTEYFLGKGYLLKESDYHKESRTDGPLLMTPNSKYSFYVVHLVDVYYLSIDFKSTGSTSSVKFEENGRCVVLEIENWITGFKKEYPEVHQLMKEFRYFLGPNSIKFIKDEE